MSKYSVKKPFTVLVGVVLVLVLGVVSFLGLNTDLLPTMDLPYVVVYTVYPGASPEKVETGVTQPLERAVATTSGLETIQSISSENVSIIIMAFSSETNMDSAMIELSNNIDMVEGYLDDMVRAPTLMKINPSMMPVQMLAVDVDGMDIKELSEYIENDLKPRLERLDGVATVDVSGSVSDHIDIYLNQEKIDDINDDILRAVDKKLYKTKNELDDARAKLESGKAELESKESEAYEKLANASAELDAGQAQAQAILSEKTKLEAQKALLLGAQQAFDGLYAINDGIRQIDSAISQLNALSRRFRGLGFDDETPFRDILAYSLPAGTPSQIVTITSPVIDGIKSTVNRLIGSGIATEDSTITSVKETLNLQKAELSARADEIKAQLAAIGIEQSLIESADSSALNNRIADIDRQIAQTDFLASQMNETLSRLKTTYAQLEKAKMEATANLAAASVQIENAGRQLESGMEQFEQARDTALKSANINSLVTQEMLSNILMAQNFSMPAGYITDGNTELTVKVGETFSSLDELENLLLVDMGIDGVKPVYLKDVADISIADNSEDSYVRINGNPGIMLSIQKSSTASTSRVSGRVNEKTAEITKENNAVHITQLMDQGVYIEMVVSSVMNNMIYGGIIALIVLIFFLKDWKPTIIIGISIPLSVLFAVVLMYFSGVNLNVMSLSGLALGIGMLVDNSIVVIENVYRLRNMGYSKIRAAVEGAQQVAGAIASSTLTTICVFVPILFTDGIARQLFTDMGLTIGYSLLASLVVALTVVPSLASFMLTSTKDTGEGIFGKITKVYEKALRYSLDKKRAVIALAVILLVFCGWSATKMPMSLIPSMDSTQMSMTLSMPMETPDDELVKSAEIIAERVRKIEDVDTVGIIMGGSGISSLMGSSGTKDVSFYVVLKEDKKLSNEKLADIITENNPEYAETLSVTASTMDLGSLSGSGISIEIKGNDLDILQSETARMAEYLKSVEGVSQVSDGTSTANEELRIEVDKKKAMQKGLTVAQVYGKVSAALKEETTATTLTIDGSNMDAVIHAAASYDRSSIGKLVVTTETDDSGNEKNVLLRDIAEISMSTSPDSIRRANQSRYMTVSLDIADGYNTTLVSRDVELMLKDYQMPKGYSYEITGESESVMSAMFDMVKMISLAIVFIYLIMVAQFQSLKSPFIVMFTIPLAFTGGLLALMLTGTELSIVAMVGFLVLAGIVVNNGIVFVDYVNQLRLSGVEKRTALVQAGKDRIRPILMTALTTILANSTMAMGIGMGAEISQGMAMVTIGGLAYATLLTLFIVPALYDVFNKKEMKRIDVNFGDEVK